MKSKLQSAIGCRKRLRKKVNIKYIELAKKVSVFFNQYDVSRATAVSDSNSRGCMYSTCDFYKDTCFEYELLDRTLDEPVSWLEWTVKTIEYEKNQVKKMANKTVKQIISVLAKLKKKEYNRKRREKIKSDSKSLEKQRALERLKYLKKKEKGQIKPISMLSSKEKSKLVKFTTGKSGYLLHKYTFCKQSNIRRGQASRWVCSQNGKCSSYIHLDNNYKLLYQAPIKHTHSPPDLMEVGPNLFIKL
ncbi:unnamed protein product, partial [Brenthis ino]